MKQILFIAIVAFSVFYSIPYYKDFNQEESKNSILVKEYIQAHKYRNYEKLEKMLLNPDDIKSAKYITVEFEDYQIIDETDDSIRIAFKRFCYDNPEINIIFQNGKIDFKNTYRNIISESKNAVKNKKYCYGFKNEPLQGILNGEYFNFDHFSSYKKEDYKGDIKKIKRIFSEKCDVSDDSANGCSKPIIDISKLKISGDGGNLSFVNYLTIINPKTNFNYIVSDGSYRITDEYNRFKIELSFKLDINNQANGYFYIDKIN